MGSRVNGEAGVKGLAAFSAEVLARCGPSTDSATKRRNAEKVETLTPLVELVALAAATGWVVGAFSAKDDAFLWKREANEVVAKFAGASNPSYCALLNYVESDAGERRLDRVVFRGLGDGSADTSEEMRRWFTLPVRCLSDPMQS